MEVVFLKDHLNHSEKDKATIDDSLGNYLIRVGVVKKYEKKKRTTKKKSK